jgi:hypothetical protein
MTVPGNLSSPLLATAADAAAAAANITKSLRFNSADSAYLARTPSSAGNRTVFTLSFWIKRTNLGSNYEILSAKVASGTEAEIYFNSSNNFVTWFRTSNTVIVNKVTTQVFRDTGAWQHFVVSSNGGTSFKIYHNGAEITDFSTDVGPSSTNTAINAAVAHNIGRWVGASNYLNGYLADIHFIDGSALDPTSFGAFDDNGVWQAAAYSGTFGTNGFHLLDFANESTIGHDSSGNNNDFTANNLSDGESPRWFFDGSAGTKITGTIGTALGSGDFTVEMFIEKTTTESQEALFSFGGSSGTFETDSGAKVRYQDGSTYGSAIAANDRTHIAWVRDNSKGYIYVDGTLVSPSSGISDTTNYTATAFAIGSRPDNGEPFTGYIDNLRVVVGTAVYTSNFTVPSTPLTAVTNTKLLTLTSPTLADTSGQSVSLTNSGVVDEAGPGKDVLFDVPTNGTQSDTGAGGEVSGCYATLNPLQAITNSPTNGNLDIAGSSTDTYTKSVSTIYIDPEDTTGYYCEFTVATTGTNPTGHIQLIPQLNVTNNGKGETGGVGLGMRGSGAGNRWYKLTDQSSSTDTGVSHANGQVIGVAVKNGKLYMSINNTWVLSGNPATESNPLYSSLSGLKGFLCGTTDGSWQCNWGQRPFSYPAPSGYRPVSSASLPTPTIADGSAYFDTALYTGNGSTQTVSGLNMSPDLVWMKTRSQANDHVLVDSVRGVGARLFPNDTIAENTQSTSLTSFNSDGFSLGSHSSVNQNNVTHVAWAWDAGSSTVSNTDGSITASVRANQTAGFSIVKYTGKSGGGSWGHGLSAAPDFILFKRYTSSQNWFTWFREADGTYLEFEGINDPRAAFSSRNNVTATSTTITLPNQAEYTNDTGSSYIAYCVSNINGYSQAGFYDGNGLSDGVFVNTKFAVRFLMIKQTNGSNGWFIWDTARDSLNPNTALFSANANNAEQSQANHAIDFLSNGFKARDSNGAFNSSSGEYAYLAFASNPFQANGGLAR